MTPPTAPERCTTCDREVCPKLLPAEHTEECRSDCPRCAAFDDCHAHRVDWRARAIAAEARIATVAAEIEHDVGVKRSHDHGRATGGQTCGTGGPLTGAPQSMLRYLDRVVRDLHDERTRAIADHAAQWAKVAPLIERLRHTRRHTKPEFVVAAIDALLAATEDVP